MDTIFVFLLIVGACIVYLLPTIIAYFRRHVLRRTILIGNVAFGWTVIGYGLSLGLSFTNHTEQNDNSKDWTVETSLDLIVCPACEREVSEQAEQCPQCGQPINGIVTD